MNCSLIFAAAFSIVLISCSSPKTRRPQLISQAEFESLAPDNVRQHLDQAFKGHDWAKDSTIKIRRKYRETSIDVVWVFYKYMPPQSWVIQKSRWVNLQDNDKCSALTIALQNDLRCLNGNPSEKAIINFSWEIIRLVRGGGGVLLMPSFSNTIDKIHRIEQDNHIAPEDKTHLIIKPSCSSIKYADDINGKTMIFRYLGGGGSIEEWRIAIDKKSVRNVHVKTILKDYALERWIPTG